MRVAEEPGSARGPALRRDIADIGRQVPLPVAIEHWRERLRVALLEHSVSIPIIGHVVRVLLEADFLYFAAQSVALLDHAISEQSVSFLR